MTSILWWTGAAIGVVIALGIIVIGAAYLARNATNAAGFGLPLKNPLAVDAEEEIIVRQI